MTINKERMRLFELDLRASFNVSHLHIEDESHLHAGHAGAEGGAGHFRVHVQSPAFNGLSKVQQHRLVYDALSSWIPHEIHALAIITN